MRHKRVSSTVVMVLVGLVLAACGGGGSATQSPSGAPAGSAAGGAAGGESGTINILGAYQSNAEAAFRDVIAQFQAANPDIEVIYSGTSDIDTVIEVRA